VSYRVLHVLDHSWPVLDGYAQRSKSIVEAQYQLGMKPMVLTGPLHQTDEPSASDTSLDGVRYLRTRADSGISAAAIRNRWPLLREVAMVRLLQQRIEALVQGEPFDIIHAHSPALCGLAALRASRGHSLPFVYEIRSFWEDSDLSPNRKLLKKLRYKLGRDLETHVTRRADAIVGIAQSILGDLKPRGVSSAKLHHVPNGVDVARFTPRPRDAALAADLEISEIPTLGFIGTFFPWEGVAWLVRAAVALRRNGTKFKLLIVGDGAEAADVRKAIQDGCCSEYVSFLGRVPNDQIERYYSVTDFLVYPRVSARITELVTPLKPLEAMALGKAILGSGVGGIRELIEPEVTGLLFEPGNIEDFCRQASRLLQQPDLRRKLGEQAREKCLQEKDWKTVVRRYEGVYESAIRNARARS